MPKQLMKVRNKLHRGPTTPCVASPEKRAHVFQVGYDAWKKYNKSATENPYHGILGEEWLKGYLSAAKVKLSSEPAKAAEGREIKPYGIVEVKKTSRKKFKIKDNVPEPKKEPELNYYLGYISPPRRKFRVWTRNPPEPKTKDE